MIAQANQNPYVKIQIQRFHSGWLSSDAVLSISLNNPEMQRYFEGIGIPSHSSVEVNQHIQHGPIIYKQIDGLHTLF